LINITNYHIWKIKKASKFLALSFIAVFFIGNISVAIFKKHINVNKNSYVMQDGFPIFTSQNKYIKFIKEYPYNAGVKLKIHTISEGETLWDLTKEFNISIETIIAANPFLKTFAIKKNDKIIIPDKNGTLFAYNNFFEINKMRKKLHCKKNMILGNYGPWFFEIISLDDIKLIFFDKQKPVLVNRAIAKLYKIREMFQKPVPGFFSSLFGERLDPFTRQQEFHTGLDIVAQYGKNIHPATDGLVLFAGWRNGYGKCILIQHKDGYSSFYGHCSRLLVKKGQWVNRKTIIGKIGSTGRSTGPHLHFMIFHHNEMLNPILYVW